MVLNIIKANSQINELTAEKDSLLKSVENVTKDLNEAQDVIGNFMVEKQTFDKKLADQKAEYEAKLAELTKQLEETKVSVNKEASQVVASLGIDPDAIKVTPKEVTPSDILATFASLQGQEKQTYYQDNKAVIVKALGLDK